MNDINFNKKEIAGISGVVIILMLVLLGVTRVPVTGVGVKYNTMTGTISEEYLAGGTKLHIPSLNK